MRTLDGLNVKNLFLRGLSTFLRRGIWSSGVPKLRKAFQPIPNGTSPRGPSVSALKRLEHTEAFRCA